MHTPRPHPQDIPKDVSRVEQQVLMATAFPIGTSSGDFVSERQGKHALCIPQKNNYSSCYFSSCQDRKSWPLCKTNWQCYLATCCLFFLCIGCSQKPHYCFRVLFDVICTQIQINMQIWKFSFLPSAICPMATIKSVWLGRLLFETFCWKQHTMFYVTFHTKRTTGEGSTIHGFGLIKKNGHYTAHGAVVRSVSSY